jgi:ATP-dependent helicase HrpA
VSLFAQQLGTKVPISDKRLSKQWSRWKANRCNLWQT